MYKFILIFLLIFVGTVSAEVVINEIMYNPAGNEYDFEYIELYGEGENISGWYFEGIDFIFPSDTFIEGYLVIANTLSEEGSLNDFLDRYPDVSCSFDYVGSLLNSGEAILLRDNEDEIIDIVVYDDWSDENCSLERKDINGYSSDPSNWAESFLGGSPGRENGVFVESGCDWSVEILLDDIIFEDLEFKIKPIKLNGDGKVNLSVDKWIEDSDGEIVKEYSSWFVENSVNYKTSSSYSPSLDEGDAYFIKANITNISCVDSNLSNNLVSSMIFIVEDEESIVYDSFIKILDIDKSAEFGDVVDVKLSVYRGDTSKYAVYAYVAEKDGTKVSEKVTMHFKNKFMNNSLTIPIQLDLNCDSKFDKDDYEVIVEGLDTSDDEEIEISGKSSDCGGSSSSTSSSTSSSSSSKTGKKFEYDIISKPYSVLNGEEFKTEVELENNDDEDYTIDIWSYVYKGSVSYSGEREGNMQSFILDEGEVKKIELWNIVDADNGDYKIKVKIRKNNQKTTNDITESIKVKEESFVSTITGKLVGNNFRNSSLTVYESSSYKAKELVPFLIISVLIVLVVILLIRY